MTTERQPECCEISRQLADGRQRVAEHQRQHTEDLKELGEIRSKLRALAAERDDWQTRAQTLAITYPDVWTPVLAELAEWRVVGQAMLREAVYYDDSGRRAHWACQYCSAESSEAERPEPYPHEPTETCGRMVRIVGATGE